MAVYAAQHSSVNQLPIFSYIYSCKSKTALFRRDETLGKTMTLAGPKAWTVDEVITLCEKYADAEADVSLLSC